MPRKIIFLIFASVFIFLIFNFEFSIFNPSKTIIIGNEVLKVEVADSEAEREQGLSGKKGLGEDEGMLFIFEREGNYSFWMKDMNFPIDIAWISKDKTIVHIEANVSPTSFPRVFAPPKTSTPALYVLETTAGFFEAKKIKIGDQVQF